MEGTSSRRWQADLPFHYGLLVAAVGALGTFACLGLGRFTLGMLLPSMGQALPLSRSEMGLISTANFIGYLAATVLIRLLLARLGGRRTITLGLGLVAGSMLLVSQAGGFAEILVLYAITGFGSAAANIPIMGLVAHWFGRRLRGCVAGCIVSASGFAIVLSGILVPEFNAVQGSGGWRLSWVVLGLMVAAVTGLAWAALRERPAELGLRPMGEDAPTPLSGGTETAGGRRSILVHLGLVYFLFGFTYIIYATFIVTTLVRERGLDEAAAGRLWSWLGLLSVASGPLFGALSDKLSRKGALMVVFACQAAAYLLVAIPLPQPSLVASMVIYGLSAWSVPSIMAAAVGDYAGPERAAAAFGTITLFFAIGQISGPAAAGIVADGWGGFSGSFAVAAGLAILAAAGSALLPAPPASKRL